MSASSYAVEYPNYCRTCGGVGGHKADPAQLPQDCPSCGWRVFDAGDAFPGRDYV